MRHINVAHTYLLITIIVRVKSLWRKKRGRITCIDGTKGAIQGLVMSGHIQERNGALLES